MELGISMFGDLSFDKSTKQFKPAATRISELLKEVELADQVGLDYFGIGEHHREDYVVSSPEIILAAAASVTKNIKLGSAVTVLSSSDPVKIFQNFSTVDLLSNGRAELMVGRGSFVESFPLFGQKLEDYNQLFEEKLDLLLNINSNKVVNWSGKFRPALKQQEIFPRPTNDSLDIWIAAGGTTASVYRAAKLGLPLMIAIIGGYPSQFTPLFDLYKEQYIKHGHDFEKMRIGIHSHALIGENSQEIAECYYPFYADQMNRIGKDRGWSAYSRIQFEGSRSPEGALFVGDSSEVVDKILYQQEMFGLTRFVAHIDVGGPDHKDILKTIELLGTKVAPEVRKALKK